MAKKIIVDGDIAYRSEFLEGKQAELSTGWDVKQDPIKDINRAVERFGPRPKDPISVFKLELLKAFEPIILPCLDFLARAIDEFNDAFPFFDAEQVRKVKKSMEPQKETLVWETTKDDRVYIIDCSGLEDGATLFIDPDRPGGLTDHQNCRCVSIPINKARVHNP